jgi:hypothetical protein
LATNLPYVIPPRVPNYEDITMYSNPREVWNEDRRTATFVVTVDDVILRAAKAGVAISRSAADEWLRDNWGALETGIDSAIDTALAQ